MGRLGDREIERLNDQYLADEIGLADFERGLEAVLSAETTELRIGSAKVNAASGSCCGKPRGCTMTHGGCLYLRHPAKRAGVFGELVCWECGREVGAPGVLCSECSKTWGCPACTTRVPRPYPTCHLCAAPKPEGATYA